MTRPAPGRRDAPRGVRRSRPAWRRFFHRRSIVAWVLAVGLGAFALGFILVTLLFFPGFGRSDISTVPDLRARPLAAAERAAAREGLEVEVADSLYNPRIRRGSVVLQTPLPGEEVTRGSTVRLVLSMGPEVRPVPSVDGLGQEQAVALLQRMGFHPRVVAVPDRAPAGRVLRLHPAAGTRAAVPGFVEVVVSAGPPRVLVPGIVGLDLESARARLGAVGLEIGGVEYAPGSEERIGSVLAQRPAAGDSLVMGRSVRVTVAGPDPSPAGLEPSDSVAGEPAPQPDEALEAGPAPLPEARGFVPPLRVGRGPEARGTGYGGGAPAAVRSSGPRTGAFAAPAAGLPGAT